MAINKNYPNYTPRDRGKFYIRSKRNVPTNTPHGFRMVEKIVDVPISLKEIQDERRRPS